MRRDDHIGTPAIRPQTEFETLCGKVPMGSALPMLYKASQSKTWPRVLAGQQCDIAIDGWFVLDGQLVMGRSEAEQQLVAAEIECDLDGFLRRIDNGFFNIVVHDRNSQRTRFINDRFGGLPLYLLAEPHALVFASSHAGLLELAASPPAHDPVGLAELYWFGYQFGERTLYRGVRCLPRASVLEVDWRDGRQTLSSYEDARAAPAAEFASPQEASDHLADTMGVVLASLHRADATYAVKVSAGMDSRFIGAAWPGRGLRAYTFGHPDSQEIALARRLAAAIGAPHTTVPLAGDFFSTLHAPIFPRHGIMEWFHQALVPAMQRDGVDLVLDGLAGDVLLGGLTLKRSQSLWRQVLGLKPDLRNAPKDVDGIARYVAGLAKVSDAGYRPLTPEAHAAVNAHWDEIHQDIVAEVKRFEPRGLTLEQLCAEVSFNNRTRRHICLQGTVCRPAVETIYPFLDRRFLALLGRFRPEWVASKRLYVELYTRHYPHVQRVPSTFSLLPFTVAPPLHLTGRVVRYALERIGMAVTHRTGARYNPWVADGIQWRRWLAFDPPLQQGALDWLRHSRAFDAQEYARAMAALKHKPLFTGSRFMLTSSYCSHFIER